VVVKVNWNSTLSRTTDIVFGVLPALFFGFWAAIGCYSTITFFTSTFNNDRLGIFLLFLISFCGLLACLSLIYVSIARENIRSRKLNMVFLAFGIVITIVLIVFPSPLNHIDTLKTVFPYFAISLVLIAVKQIYFLSRVAQKVSL
jgi:hypothetical protein